MSEAVLNIDETTEIAKTEEVVEEPKKAYELRRLMAKDIYPMTKIINKIGFKKIKECFADEGILNLVKEMLDKNKSEEISDEDKVKVGIEIGFIVGDLILDNLSSCEEHINHLLSSLSGISKKDISELPPATYIEMIMDVVKLDEFKDFVQAALKSLNK